MIEPIQSLAFSIQANRGVYAILIGSGISRSAEIPTGWEITLEFVRKLANLRGVDCEPSPEAWYERETGKQPDYSELLESLATTPAARQQLLRPYLEPSEEEREQGKKLPTAAHKAIAKMVSSGFIKVIITTNFDRLMEKALEEVGIVPDVLSTVDEVTGARPLIHSQCSVIKVHGDYLDPRILNTPLELEKYAPEFDQLLDRVFDEFGLVVCGWSADWDKALRRSIERAKSRRFSTYWATQRDPSYTARKLIAHRGAHVISIQNADSFFTTIQQQVQSLEQFSRPHPLSTEAAVASLKRLMSEDKYRIQLHDLVEDEVKRVISATTGPKFSMDASRPSHLPDSKFLKERLKSYDYACQTLMTMGVNAGYWIAQGQYEPWKRALSALSTRRESKDNDILLNFQSYPATLLFYSLGIGAIESENWEFLAELFNTRIIKNYQGDLSAVEMLPAKCLHKQTGEINFLGDKEHQHTPLNFWLQETLRPFARKLIPDDKIYKLNFDWLEILMALRYGFINLKNKRTQDWLPLGIFGLRNENRTHILQEISESLSSMKEESPFLRNQMIGDSIEMWDRNCTKFNEIVDNFCRSWH